MLLPTGASVLACWSLGSFVPNSLLPASVWGTVLVAWALEGDMFVFGESWWVSSDASADSRGPRLMGLPRWGPRHDPSPWWPHRKVAPSKVRDMSSEGAASCFYVSEEFDDESVCLIED